MIRVCIVEDILEIREGLTELLQKDSQISVIKTYANAESAIPDIIKLCPDIVIADINLPGMSGVECVRLVKEKEAKIQFIMFTIHEDNELVFEALKVGASGYLLKNTSSDQIISALIDLQNGGSPMTPTIARKVINYLNTSKNTQIEDLLTKREFEIIQLLSKGYLYKEIADQLDIALSTVKRHINHIYEKLQVQNKTEAINMLLRR